MKDIPHKREAGEPPYDICQRTFQFALQVVRLGMRFDVKSEASRILAKHLLRSGTSVGANIEEGQAAQSRADFVSKYSIARKEAREANYWLRLISASGISNDAEIPQLIGETQEVLKILTTIIKNAKNE